MMSLNVPCFDMGKMYSCCQSFMWDRMLLNDGCAYIVISGNEMVAVRQQHGRTTFSCSQEKVFDFWFEYFDLVQDYVELSTIASNARCEASSDVISAAGLHVLKLGMLETVVGVVCMRKSSPASTRKKMKLLRSIAGRSRESSFLSARLKWNEMPSTEDILDNDRKLNATGMFCDVLDVVEVLSESDVDVLADIVSLGNADAMKLLRQTDCFTALEAKRILSWGLGRKDIVCVPKEVNERYKKKLGVDAASYFKQKDVSDWCFDGRADYFNQVSCYGYIERMSRRGNRK